MKKLTTKSFIEKAESIHGNLYDYSKTEYKGGKEKICIICKEHGEFWQLPYNHLKGCGCPKCSGNSNYTTNEYIQLLKEKYPNSPYSFDRITYVNNTTPITLVCKEHGAFTAFPSSLAKKMTECPICQKKRLSEQMTSSTEEFLVKAKEVHGDKYDYSKVNYINAKNKVCIICHKHGEFWKLPSEHLQGHGCPKCSNEHLWDKRTDKPTTDAFIKKAQIIHNHKYSYDKTEYTYSNKKVCIKCPEHGEFWMLPYPHLNGQGCPKCGKIALASYFTKDFKDVVEEANLIHNNKYDYSKAEYKNCNAKMCIICPEHGEFWQTPSSHLHGHGCPMCAIGKNKSIGEEQVLEFINSIIDTKPITNNRNIIPPSELDIFLPKYNIAIEYDGLYYHSVNFVDKQYNVNKTIKCSEKNIKLLHIFEDEWYSKPNIVKSQLSHIFNKTKKKIYARNCKVRKISGEESLSFLNENHLQGYFKSDYFYGLFFQGELLSVMSFSKMDGENSFYIDRFCTKTFTAIIGGASKLLKYFIKDFNVLHIQTSVDRRWSNGELYKKLGFTFVKYNEPKFYYFTNNKRFEASQNNLVTNKNKKIYDCGSILLKLDVKNNRGN